MPIASSHAGIEDLPFDGVVCHETRRELLEELLLTRSAIGVLQTLEHLFHVVVLLFE